MVIVWPEPLARAVGAEIAVEQIESLNRVTVAASDHRLPIERKAEA